MTASSLRLGALGPETNCTFLTSKERDNETGLDYFGARYYGSAQGRFASVDDFISDSQVGDPQSWNKYAYVRNNPVKFIDPTGQLATVAISTDEERKRGTITVTASIAIYTKDGKISAKQLQAAQAQIKRTIEKAWTGKFEKDGVTFEVTTTVDVQVHASEEEASSSGAQNVIQIINDGEGSWVDGDLNRVGPDTGTWQLSSGDTGQAAHEFGHLLGVDDRYKGRVLMHTSEGTAYETASASDFGWAFGSSIKSHRKPSVVGYAPIGSRTRIPIHGMPLSRKTVRTQRAGFGVWWE